MNDSKKMGLPVGDTTGKAEAGAETEQATTTENDFTTAAGSRQMGIARFLSYGADRGLHLTDLVRLTDLPERTVRLMIHQERRQHVLILSDNRNGYFLPSSEHEKTDCVQSLRRRAAEILEAADGIEAAEIGGE